MVAGLPESPTTARITLTLGSRDFFWLAPGARCERMAEIHDATHLPDQARARRSVDGAPTLVCRQGPASRRCASVVVAARRPRRRGGDRDPPGRRRGRGPSRCSTRSRSPTAARRSRAASTRWWARMDHSVLGQALGLRRPARPVYAAQLLALILEQAAPQAGGGLGHARAGRRGQATPVVDVRDAARSAQGAVRRAVQHLDHLRLHDADGAPKPLICKVFRTLQAGENPDVDRAGRPVRGRVDRVPTMVGTRQRHLAERRRRRRAGTRAPRLCAGVLPRHRGRLARRAARRGRPRGLRRVGPAAGRGHRGGARPPRGGAPHRARVARGDRGSRGRHARALRRGRLRGPGPRGLRAPDRRRVRPRRQRELACAATHPRRLPPRPGAQGRRAAAGSCSTSRASRCGPSPSATGPTSPCATSPACCARSTTRRVVGAVPPRRQRPRLGRGAQRRLPRRVCRAVGRDPREDAALLTPSSWTRPSTRSSTRPATGRPGCPSPRLPWSDCSTTPGRTA